MRLFQACTLISLHVADNFRSKDLLIWGEEGKTPGIEGGDVAVAGELTCLLQAEWGMHCI